MNMRTSRYNPGQSRSKRSPYVARACQQCKRRKVKCSGQQPEACRPCLESNAVCVYSSDPRKRRRPTGSVTAAEPLVPRAVGRAGSATTPSGETVHIPSGAKNISPRTSSQTQTVCAQQESSCQADGSRNSPDTCVVLSSTHTRDVVLDKTHATTTVTPPPEPGVEPAVEPDDVRRLETEGYESTLEGPSPAGFLRQYPQTTLTLGGAPGFDERVSNKDPQPAPSSRECCRQHLQLWPPGNDHEEMLRVRRVLERYFEHLNPYYFCLIEVQFFAQFDEYQRIRNGDDVSDDTLQFVALVWSILAHMHALEDNDKKSALHPGWDDYLHATHLLGHTMELGHGDLATIQCLILHACYLLTASVSQHKAAYSVLAQAVRLSYQIGLHNQPSWRMCSPFETHTRQRVFWTVYNVDRTIAQICLVPYLFRDSEINVDLPLRVDDKLLGTSEELPEESPSCSLASYLHEVVRYSRLASEIWDKFTGARSSNPRLDEFIAIMDARILHFRSGLPAFLQLEPGTVAFQAGLSPRACIIWQALMLRLLTNNLRLLLRTKWGSGAVPVPGHQETCVSICSENVDLLHEVYHLVPHERFHKSIFVTYLAGAIKTLATVVLSDKELLELRRRAAPAFQKAMELLRQILPRVATAREVMKKLEQVVKASEELLTRERSILLTPPTDTWPEQGEEMDLETLPEPGALSPGLFLLDDLDFRAMMQGFWIPGAETPSWGP
ncbi:hypothetical protein FOPE_10169 [Fonsecaea pedrosoi]|nr:hypothetical protein FOPE_10169 [Fonsecaea pedrosoi]